MLILMHVENFQFLGNWWKSEGGGVSKVGIRFVNHNALGWLGLIITANYHIFVSLYEILQPYVFMKKYLLNTRYFLNLWKSAQMWDFVEIPDPSHKILKRNP